MKFMKKISLLVLTLSTLCFAGRKEKSELKYSYVALFPEIGGMGVLGSFGGSLMTPPLRLGSLRIRAAANVGVAIDPESVWPHVGGALLIGGQKNYVELLVGRTLGRENRERPKKKEDLTGFGLGYRYAPGGLGFFFRGNITLLTGFINDHPDGFSKFPWPGLSFGIAF